MKRKKRILFFLWSFSLGGGAEKILSTIVNNIDLSKYDIDILEIEHFDKGYEKVPKEVKILKPLVKYTYPKIIKALLWRLRIYFPKLTRRLLIKNKYDIEISFTIMNPPFQFSKNPKVKKFAWIHGSIEDFLTDKIKHKMHKKELSKADKIITISEKTYESIIAAYPYFKNKIQIIHNGYNIDEISTKANESIDISIPEKSICSIGRIEDMKGSDRTLELIKKLHKLGKKYHMFYIGSGDLENELKARVEKYDLTNYVHFLGYQKNPYKYLAKMDCLVSMSKQEGFPGIYVEAISLGIPFVTTNVGGAKELCVNGDFGDMIFSDDEAIEKIISIVEKNKTINKTKALEFIKQFTIQKQIDSIESLLK